MSKKILSLMLTLVMVLGVFSAGFAVPADVVGTDVEQAVDTLSKLGVLTGYPDGTFKPADNITRAEYSAVAVRAKELKAQAVTMAGNTVFGDVSSSHWASGYINVAEDKDIIKGMGMVNGVNTFGPELNITYEQAVTIIVRALGYESAAQNAGGYPSGYLAVAGQEGLLEDVNGSLGSLASRGLVAQLTYNALDTPMMIKVGSNFVKSGTQGTEEVYLFNALNSINKAAASGNWGAINKDTFAEAGITGVTNSNIGSFKDTLEALANGDNQIWSPTDIQGVFNTLATGNKVVLAKAINATQIQIVFNTELDSADAKTNPAYKVSISGVTFVGTPVLSENAKTLTLTTGSAMNLNNAALVIEPIQLEGNPTVTTERYTSLFSYKDMEDPMVKEVSSMTNSSIASKVVVKFTEPIQSLGSVRINGSLKGATGFSVGDDEAIFTGLALDSSETHEIQFINLKDRAGNTAGTIEETFSIVIDIVAPKVSLSTSEDRDNVIVLEFDKPVTTASATAALVNGVVKNESLGMQASMTAVPINPANGLASKYEMDVTGAFTTLSTRNLTVLIPAGIKDTLGNEVVTTNKTVTLKKDITAPEIELVRVIRDANGNVTDLVVSTDSTLSAKAIVNPLPLAGPGSLNIVDPDGVLVLSNAWLGGLSQDPILAGNKDITLSFATPGKLSGEYKLTFASAFAQDQADTPNNLKSKVVMVDFGPATSSGSFTITALDVTSGGTNIFDINYGAPVKGGSVAGSATDLSNYTLDGVSLPVGTTITLDPTKIFAKITLPAESIAMANPSALLNIYNVQRLTGETIDPFTATVALVDNVKPLMTSAVLTNDNRLVVGFSEDLAGIPTSTDFRIKINGKTVTTTPAFVAGIGSDAGKYVADLGALVLNDLTQTYIDVDGDAAYMAANDVFVKTEAVQTAFSMKTSPIVSSLSIETIAGTTVDLSTPANALTIGTVKTAK